MNKGNLLRSIGILTYIALTIIDRFCFNIADHIYITRVSINDLDAIIKTIVENIVDLNWINDLPPRLHKGFKAAAAPTIKYIKDICDNIKGCSIYVNQLLRCSSSVGANLHEARYAQSRADFIHKLEISLKEAYESEYWLELLFRKSKISQEEYRYLINKSGGIRRKLIASITTAKANAT